MAPTSASRSDGISLHSEIGTTDRSVIDHRRHSAWSETSVCDKTIRSNLTPVFDWGVNAASGGYAASLFRQKLLMDESLLCAAIESDPLQGSTL